MHSLEEGNSCGVKIILINISGGAGVKGKLCGEGSNPEQVTFKLNFDDSKKINKHMWWISKGIVQEYNSASCT